MDRAKDTPTPKLTARQHVDRAIRMANELRDEIEVLATEHPIEAQALGLSSTDLSRLAGRLHTMLALLPKETA